MTKFTEFPFSILGGNQTRTDPARWADFINVAEHAAIVADGVTDNVTPFAAFAPFGKTYGKTFPVTVTVTIASPAVISWANHGLRVNEAVVFSTTGALPTGLTAGTTYYVISAGLTANAFRVSTKNPWPNFDGEGSAVNTSGSQSGVHSAQIQGYDWQNVFLPQGPYYVSTSSYLNGNQRRFRQLCYGASSDNLGLLSLGLASDYSFNRNLSALTADARMGATTITLLTNTDSSLFQIYGMACFVALDLQNGYNSNQSFPPNNHYVEFVRITGINPSTGVLTLQDPLRNSYKSTYPQFYAGTYPPASSGAFPAGGGCATLYPMCSDWDQEVEIHGLHSTNASGGPGGGALTVGARSLSWIDCVFDADGSIPTVSKIWRAINCRWADSAAWSDSIIEIDKLVEDCEFIRCVAYECRTQSSSVDRLVVSDCRFQNMTGTARNTHIKDSDIPRLIVGPLAFGASENLLIENSRIGQILESVPGTTGLRFPYLINRFSFSGGTLTEPIASTAANQWAVPGRRVYMRDVEGVFFNMGSPFTVLDVYKSGSNFCIDTDLTSLPVGNSTNATVTITIASPAVVSWTAHGLIADTPICFQTTGALPTGISNAAIYYLISAGLATDSFQFSATKGGSAVNTSGSQSGTQTCIAHPLMFQPQACPRVTVRNCTGCAQIVDLSNGPDEVPLFSYASREYIGSVGTNVAFVVQPFVYGKLVYMTIEVLRAYTGAAGTFTMTISAVGFDDSLVQSDLSQIINLKLVGPRTVTAAAATGGQSGDTIAAFAHWISGQVSVVYSSEPNEALNVYPRVRLTIQTDQGYGSSVIGFQGTQEVHPILLSDATTPSL